MKLLYWYKIMKNELLELVIRLLSTNIQYNVLFNCNYCTFYSLCWS